MMIKKMKLSDLDTLDIETVDVFISFCGFEKRCLSVIKNISQNKVKEALIFINKEKSTESKSNLVEFQSILQDKICIKEIDFFNPIELTDTMVQAVMKIDINSHVLVDITSFTHEALLIFIAILNKYVKKAQICYIYSNASIYASELENSSERWLSRGIREVRSVLGYAGDLKPSQETVLIMMVGYECERAWQVIDTLSPEKLYITYNDASGSTDQTNRDANRLHADLLKELAAYYQNPDHIIIPSNNPFETARKLEEVVDKIGNDKNIIIAPMNNKLATFGAALVALKKPNIQLCYAPALYYNTSSYSVEGDMCYLFSLDDSL